MSHQLNHCNGWYWTYDPKADLVGIVIVTTDGLKYSSNTIFGSNFLNTECWGENTTIAFNEEDKKAYVNFYERLGDVIQDRRERTKTALNATCVKRFHKTVPLVDECFQNVDTKRAPDEGEVVVVATSFRDESGKSREGNMLVVDSNESSCYCLQISDVEIPVKEGFRIKKWSCAHISHNRTISASALNFDLLQTLNIA